MFCDVAIIGGGPGGYSAALKAVKNAASVVLIEADELGGVCLNRGCIPSKTLLKSASLFRDINKSSNYGIDVENVSVSMQKIIERKNKVVSALKSGLTSHLKAEGIQIINAPAKIEGNRIIVGDTNVEAKKIIIATGSSPAKPSIKGIDSESVIFSDQVFLMDQIPSSIVIIGGGVIGLEFSSFFNMLGSKVSVIELKDEILQGFDEEIQSEASKLFMRHGIDIITGAKVIEIKDGIVVFEKEGETKEVTGEKILVSTGRTPNTKGLFDKNSKIKMDKGFISVDKKMRTNIENIYAVGDVVGKSMLAHSAMAEGIIAANNALGNESEMSYSVIPKCVYTFPEIASVGLTENEAVASGYQVKKAKAPVRSNGRALADGTIEGFIKILADEKSERILGVHIIGPYATEMITEAEIAIIKRMKIDEFDLIIHPHPTVSELIGNMLNDM